MKSITWWALGIMPTSQIGAPGLEAQLSSQSASCRCVSWEAAGDGSTSQVPAQPMGHPDQVLSSRLGLYKLPQPRPEDIWDSEPEDQIDGSLSQERTIKAPRISLPSSLQI